LSGGNASPGAPLLPPGEGGRRSRPDEGLPVVTRLSPGSSPAFMGRRPSSLAFGDTFSQGAQGEKDCGTCDVRGGSLFRRRLRAASWTRPAWSVPRAPASARISASQGAVAGTGSSCRPGRRRTSIRDRRNSQGGIYLPCCSPHRSAKSGEQRGAMEPDMPAPKKRLGRNLRERPFRNGEGGSVYKKRAAPPP